jgi:hypothetical protein
MDMVKRILGLFFVFFGLAIAPGAKAAAVRCEGCSDAQARDAAKTLGFGQHIVSSFSTNRIWLFRVFDRNAGEPGAPIVVAVTSDPVPADVQALFAEVRDFYLFTGGTMKAAVLANADDLNVPGLTGASAFDVVSDANLRARLGDRLASAPLPSLGQALNRMGNHITQGLLGLIGAGDGSIEVTIVFSDGTEVVYLLSPSSGTGQYLEGRSRTATGQLIPDRNAPHQYEGNWSGAGHEVQRLSIHMQYVIGATILHVPPTPYQVSSYMRCEIVNGNLRCSVSVRP